MKRIALAVLLLAIMITGCAHRFYGTFIFKNSSNTQLWAEASGFKSDLPVGVLIPGALKGSGMEPMQLPKFATIFWSEGKAYWSTKAEQNQTNISLSSLSTFPGSGNIVFEYTTQRVWTVRYEADYRP